MVRILSKCPECGISIRICASANVAILYASLHCSRWKAILASLEWRIMRLELSCKLIAGQSTVDNMDYYKLEPRDKQNDMT